MQASNQPWGARRDVAHGRVRLREWRALHVQPAPEHRHFPGKEEDCRGDQGAAQAPVAGLVVVAPLDEEVQQQEKLP